MWCHLYERGVAESQSEEEVPTKRFLTLAEGLNRTDSESRPLFSPHSFSPNYSRYVTLSAPCFRVTDGFLSWGGRRWLTPPLYLLTQLLLPQVMKLSITLSYRQRIDCFGRSYLSPRSHNQLVSAQVQSQLGEILHSWTGKLWHPRPQRCTQKEPEEEE